MHKLHYVEALNSAPCSNASKKQDRSNRVMQTIWPTRPLANDARVAQKEERNCITSIVVGKAANAVHNPD
jgi:hypothetical protein